VYADIENVMLQYQRWNQTIAEVHITHTSLRAMQCESQLQSAYHITFTERDSLYIHKQKLQALKNQHHEQIQVSKKMTAALTGVISLRSL
jgi:hypothetical protein